MELTIFAFVEIGGGDKMHHFPHAFWCHMQPDATSRPAEKIADVPIYNGQGVATLVREVDPAGAIVEHRVRKSSYAHEKMLERGSIDADLHGAGERFRAAFERAGMTGRFASVDMHKVRDAGSQQVSDAVATARIEVNRALGGLGVRSLQSGFCLSKSCIWHVIGCGATLEEWALRVRNNGKSMTPDRASGILIAALEKLALHYEIMRVDDVRRKASGKQWEEGKKFGERAAVTDLHKQFLVIKAKPPAEAISDLENILNKKVAKFTTGA